MSDRRVPGSAAMAALLAAAGLVLRLAPIAEDPLHPDECLYASWAQAVWPGGDLLLRGVVIDKPPFFPYLLALWSQIAGPGPTALRLLGVACAAASMWLVFRIARRRWGGCAGVAGLALMALSPASISLDATAFTDPPAVALALGAAAAAAAAMPAWAGVLLGLAVATKPTAISYAFLAVALLPRVRRRELARLAAGLAAVMVAVAAWEWLRQPELGFVSAALEHYGLDGGGLSIDAAGWLQLLRWIWASPWALALWAAVLLAGALVSVRHGWGEWRPLAGVTASAVAYLSLHLAAGAPAWDRYLLGLVPLAALAYAWAAGRLSSALRRRWQGLVGAVAAAAMAAALVTPALEAAQSRLPLGDTSYWQGIETVADYVRGQVPGRATILYRDLGWHVLYYMAGFPQDFRWFQQESELAAGCAGAQPCYLLSSSDNTGSDRQYLEDEGYMVTPRLTTYRHDGSRALTLSLVEAEAR